MTLPLPPIYVVTEYPPKGGGAEKKARRLAATLARSGLPITVLTKGFPGLPDREQNEGVTVVRLGGEGNGGTWGFYLALARELYKRRKEYGLIHHFLFSTSANVCCLLAPLLGKPVLLAPGGTGNYGGTTDSTTLGRCAKLKFLHIKWSGTSFVAMSTLLLQELKEAGVRPGRLFLLSNPVDTAFFHPVETGERVALRDKLAFKGITFLFVGRLARQKGLDRLFSAVKALTRDKDFRIVLAGSGPEEMPLRGLAKQYGITDRIVFAGEQAYIRPYYQAADYFILPSRGEGMSNAMLEAMACGLPPVVSSVSGTELVEQETSGIIFPNTDDPVPLTKAMLDCLGMPHARRELLGLHARARVEENCSLPSITNKLLSLYGRLAGGDA